MLDEADNSQSYRIILRKEEWFYLFDNLLKDLDNLSAGYAVEYAKNTDPTIEKNIQNLRVEIAKYKAMRIQAGRNTKGLVYFMAMDGTLCFERLPSSVVDVVYKSKFNSSLV